MAFVRSKHFFFFLLGGFVGDSGPEIVNTMTGKTEDHQVSRLAKKIFFTRFVEIVQKLPSAFPVRIDDLSSAYGENKERCISYQVRVNYFLLSFSIL